MSSHLSRLTLTFSILIYSPFLLAGPARAEDSCEAWLATPGHQKEILKITETAMRTAGKEILALRNSNSLKIQTKRHFADVKTAGDCGSQSRILGTLAQNELTKHANFMAEEKCTETNDVMAKNSSSVPGTWILDPIDGTTNYANNLPHFSISLAYVVRDKVCFGAVYAPVLQEFYYAFKDHGAFIKHSAQGAADKISVSKTESLEQTLWITGTEAGPKPEAADKNTKTFAMALKLLPKTQDMRRFGSAALDLAYVASGKAQGFFELSEGLNWWDIAAGTLLVTEAGGKVSTREPQTVEKTSSTFLDRPIVYVLATNGNSPIHHEFESLLIETFNSTK